MLNESKKNVYKRLQRKFHMKRMQAKPIGDFENETCKNYLKCMGFATFSAKAYSLNQLTLTFGLNLTKLSKK